MRRARDGSSAGTACGGAPMSLTLLLCLVLLSAPFLIVLLGSDDDNFV
jgi:hypothetical protein